MSRRQMAYLPPQRAPKIASLCSSPVVIALDPGGTTGWSVWQVHPEALCQPNVLILENIEFWQHGQVDCGSKKGDAGTSRAVPVLEVLPEIGQDVLDERIAIAPGIEEYPDFAEDDPAGDVFPSIKGAESLGTSVAGECAGVSELLLFAQAWPGACHVIEDFILRKTSMDRELLSPVRVTAAYDFGLWMQGMRSFRQQPSMAKATASDQRLRQWGLYRSTGAQRHARDADRHAITWLRRCSTGKSGQELREASWPHIYGIIERDGERIVAPYHVSRLDE